MKSVSCILVLALLILTAKSYYKVGQSNCEVCVQTYSVNCTICYDTCNDNRPMTQCKKLDCTARDAGGKCTQWSNTAVNSSSCLGTCCAGLVDSETPFSQSNFNLCIQRDAANQKNQINIGLTLGLILGLLCLLFLSGLAYQFGILCFDDKVLDPQDNKMGDVLNPPQTSADNIRGSNNKLGDINDIWQTQGLVVNGKCPLCDKDGINIVANCQHGFHYDCLSRRVSQMRGEPFCPFCQQPGSLQSARIYCSSCRQQYKMFNGRKQKLDPVASEAMHRLKCPTCSN